MMLLLLTTFLFSFCSSEPDVVAVQEFTTEYTNGGSGSFKIHGYEPSGSGNYPLFVYVQGTYMNYWGSDAKTYTNYMASNSKSFVAASLEYENEVYPGLCSGFENKASLMFNSSNSKSALSVLCARDNVDCTKGIVLNGYSQGAQIVSLSANYGFNSSIRGVLERCGGDELTTDDDMFNCLKYNSLTIDNLRIRSMGDENDEFFGHDYSGVVKEQEAITGISSNCNGHNCIQRDGNGWYIVLHNETASGKATHCYAYTNSNCADTEFDANYYPKCPNCIWSLQSNYEWLINQVY